MSHPALYVVLHLYKTAGQTLRRNFELNFGGKQWLPMYAHPIGLDKSRCSANPGWDEAKVGAYVRERLRPEVRCVFGHMAFWGLHELPQTAGRETRYIVFLRDPVARIISLYNYLRGHSTNVWHDEIVGHGWSLEEWFQHSRGLWLHNGQLRQLLLARYPEVAECKTLEPRHLEAGKHMLEKMWFVGLTEHFAHDAAYLYGMLRFRRFYPEPVVNASRGPKDPGATARRLIADGNQLDRELYEHARHLRQQYFARHRRQAVTARLSYRLAWLLDAMRRRAKG